MSFHKTDVFIVGGGPAGLAAAIAARQKGFQVTVADAARPPVDKACGEGLMPDSLAALERLGVRLDEEEQSFAFRGIRFWGDGRSVEGCFPKGHGIGIRRVHLHRLLIEHAAEAGISLLWGARVTGVTGQTVSVDGRTVHCDWVVGADGLNSRVRRWAGLDAARRDSQRFGFRRHYRIVPWTDRMEIYWGPGCQMYVTPVSSEEVCVVVLSRDPHLRFDAALPRFPELQQKLSGANLVSPERGAVTASRSFPRVFHGRTVLIGDASGSVDAITGEGMCLAFQQAVSLAAALEQGRLAAYQSEHRRLARRPAWMARFMLLLEHGWIRSRVLGAMACEPNIFAHLLETHVGERSPSEFFFEGMLPLGRRILSAS